MSATVRQLLDENNNKVYPVGTASAVYMREGLYTVQQAWDDLQEGNQTIKFPSSDQIRKELSTGRVVDTIFNSDGSITETVKESDGTVVQTKTTKFNEDGSINIVVV